MNNNKVLYIELQEGLKNTSYATLYNGLKQEYKPGDILKVIPADNIPVDSKILYWVMSDGWDSDSYGLPIYKDFKYTLPLSRIVEDDEIRGIREKVSKAFKQFKNTPCTDTLAVKKAFGLYRQFENQLKRLQWIRSMQLKQV